MYDTDKQRLDAIARTAHDMDINSQESEILAQEEIDYMSGELDVTPDEDAEVPDAMPLPTALALISSTKYEGFQLMQAVAEEMRDQFSAKGEDVKATQDSRTLHATMALGIKKLLVEWGARVTEAKERLEKTTPDERRKVGNIDDLLREEDAPVDDRHVGAPSAAVQSSTKRAQAFLAKKSDATRN